MGGYYNGKDSVDISELAALDADISDDMIERLQQQLTDKIEKNSDKKLSESNKTQQPMNENDDSTLFEEVDQKPLGAQQDIPTDIAIPEASKENVENNVSKDQSGVSEDNVTRQKEKLEVNQSFDDNFIKKYKAKLQKMAKDKNEADAEGNQEQGNDANNENALGNSSEPIEKVSKGKISEKHLTKELKDYNDSLDFLDGNVKYSKYVIYIDPENINFIESLTVKERKNLINTILRQQDDILITKKRFRVIQNLFLHILISVIIFLTAVPVVYYVINASLEATINNHRNAQSNWQVLYKEHGKISKNK